MAIPLSEPADGIPAVVDGERALLSAAAAIAQGVGPVAIDAERASGYRYGQRAYLVQLRREGAGTFLIDPIACPDLTPLDEAVGPELAARLLGLPRVGLAAVVEHYLGLSLAKEHSAVDWSTRPLPTSWLRYAALDVEVLDELRNLMGVDLARADKAQWAREEFDALLTWMPTERADPWRRLSGLSSLKTRRGLAIARELWWARDDIARDRDISPGRIIPDAALLDVAAAAPREASSLPRSNRAIERYARTWLAAVARGHELPEDALPPRVLPADGPPPPRSWGEKDPVAAARLAATREALTEFATHRTIPVENVVSPDPLRRVVWRPPATPDAASFEAALSEHGVRPWQAAIVAPMLEAAFAGPSPT